MPQMSGIDFIEKIREKDTNGKIKIITRNYKNSRTESKDRNFEFNDINIKYMEKSIKLHMFYIISKEKREKGN